MIRRPPRSTQSRSSAASDVYKRQQGCRSELVVASGRRPSWQGSRTRLHRRRARAATAYRSSFTFLPFMPCGPLRSRTRQPRWHCNSWQIHTACNSAGGRINAFQRGCVFAPSSRPISFERPASPTRRSTGLNRPGFVAGSNAKEAGQARLPWPTKTPHGSLDGG